MHFDSTQRTPGRPWARPCRRCRIMRPHEHAAQLRTGRRQLRPDRPAEGGRAARRRGHRDTPAGARLQRGAGLARRVGLRGRRGPVLPGQHRRMPGLEGAGGRRDAARSPAAATTTASRRTPSRWPSTTSSPSAPRRWWCRPTGPPAARDWFGDAERAQALVDGWKRACDTCGVAWGGGETPALAGIVEAGRIDLAASCTGLVNPK